MRGLASEVRKLGRRAVEVLGDRLAGILMFGSAARPSDFTTKSDVNIVIVVKDRPKGFRLVELLYDIDTRLFVSILTLKDLESLVEAGHPLAHHLCGDSTLLYYGCEELVELLSSKPPITEDTLKYLEGAALANLAVAAQNYLYGLYGESASFSYKAVKTALRLRAAVRGLLPFSDEEVLSFAEQEGLDEAARALDELSKARRGYVGPGEALKLLDLAAEGVSKAMNIKLASWSRVLEELCKAGMLSVERVSVSRAENEGVWVVRAVDTGGLLHEVKVGKEVSVRAVLGERS